MLIILPEKAGVYKMHVKPILHKAGKVMKLIKANQLRQFSRRESRDVSSVLTNQSDTKQPQVFVFVPGPTQHQHCQPPGPAPRPSKVFLPAHANDSCPHYRLLRNGEEQDSFNVTANLSISKQKLQRRC